MPKTFYVLWTYIANYSRLIPVKANSAEEALRETTYGFADKFRENASVFVFDSPPSCIQYKGQMVSFDEYRELSKERR